jgi:hypothetical protein
MKKQFSLFGIVLVVVLSVGLKGNSGNPAIINPVNMYIYDTLLLVSDSTCGLLIYSIANDKEPRFKARIPLKGSRGAAMKDSIIYANSWNGILALRLLCDTNYEVTSVIKTDPYHSDMMMYNDVYYPGGFGCSSKSEPVMGAASDNTTKTGAGGSYAVFAVIDTFLYYIDKQSLITMDISTPAKPYKLSETYIDWSIETLFPTDKYLFIGGTSGMYAMDRSDPVHPVQIGSITHFRARDPVVIKDSMAYVTLRSGADRSWDAKDELMVVNLSAIAKPNLVKEVSLPTPYGLAIHDTLVYVAQGGSGWTLFGLSNPQSPAILTQWSTPAAKDFIWEGSRLYMMCFDKIRIYSVADPGNPLQLSEIK